MSAEVFRRVTGLLELDAGLPFGALTAKGRGARGVIFGRYLAAYILTARFNLTNEDAAALLERDRSTVTKALKVFRFLEGYGAWRAALDKIARLCEDFVAYGAARAEAWALAPPPVGRGRKNDPLPAWVRDRYAQEIEAQAEAQEADEARARVLSDSIYLRHPAVAAITDDPDLRRLIGEPVVSVTLSPPDGHTGQPLLLVPPTERDSGAIALRLLVKGSSPSELQTMAAARHAAQRALLRKGYRLTGVAETFPVRGQDGWRYIPLHIAEARA